MTRPASASASFKFPQLLVVVVVVVILNLITGGMAEWTSPAKGNPVAWCQLPKADDNCSHDDRLATYTALAYCHSDTASMQYGLASGHGWLMRAIDRSSLSPDEARSRFLIMMQQRAKCVVGQNVKCYTDPAMLGNLNCDQQD
ncbi:hypothetical protein BCV70DRAFT_229930 [Testicularia cyperi]|uniref:Uncharacterized protein n=1 Tax=Testicularia cyperi TaxID=1882483 RepID=A0A317Y0M0_9BASI|nr:hypothetical protein BCV70DRAFT_229930 [Testicularia cyperi]